MHSPSIRLVRPAPETLGLYVRAGRLDQKDLQSFIAVGASGLAGVVFEAKRVTLQKELLTLVLERRLDAVLDPQTQPMATIGGYVKGMDGLPWSEKRPHTLGDLASPFAQRQLVEKIAQFVVQHGFTQVLAPTHLITGPDDPWLAIDIACANALRSALERHGASHVPVNYSLALTYEAFRTPAKRHAVLAQLQRMSSDCLWLNIDGCGSSSSPTAVTRYVDAATDFHTLGKAVVADHVGGLVGLSLLAFGAVGGLAHGVTLGERFDTAGWHKPPQGKPFGQKPRIYLPKIDMLLSRDDAKKFFELGGGKARTHFGCRDTRCCARGITDMLHAPVHHFLYQRTREVAGLGRIPESLRPSQFLEEHLRPATDAALLATRLTLPETLAEKAVKQNKRLNDLRIVLGPYAQKRRDASFARHPMTRVAREVLG
ncbi:MAG: hypothetical protein WCF44_09630 [Candidatus Methylophosphatis roskildensis]